MNRWLRRASAIVSCPRPPIYLRQALRDAAHALLVLRDLLPRHQRAVLDDGHQVEADLRRGVPVWEFLENCVGVMMCLRYGWVW